MVNKKAEGVPINFHWRKNTPRLYSLLAKKVPIKMLLNNIKYLSPTLILSRLDIEGSYKYIDCRG